MELQSKLWLRNEDLWPLSMLLLRASIHSRNPTLHSIPQPELRLYLANSSVDLFFRPVWSNPFLQLSLANYLRNLHSQPELRLYLADSSVDVVFRLV